MHSTVFLQYCPSTLHEAQDPITKFWNLNYSGHSQTITKWLVEHCEPLQQHIHVYTCLHSNSAYM